MEASRGSSGDGDSEYLPRNIELDSSSGSCFTSAIGVENATSQPCTHLLLSFVILRNIFAAHILSVVL